MRNGRRHPIANNNIGMLIGTVYACGHSETFGLGISKMDLFVTTLVFNYIGVVGGARRHRWSIYTRCGSSTRASLSREPPRATVIAYRRLLIADNNNIMHK